ncbi:TMV resistance protein N-like [Eucalyptus grandis]|uniref:TMV resistance protein N-like n=1 Tax=Eucalyptus grandis TaxID=71139 RepID=UPI00192F097F|nr:TMV resistance protein N-like [Eucalyptus grandis]
MECKAQKELIVLPVFYKMESREVRWAIKGYGRAMAKHESNSEKDQKAVETWKKALFNANNLSGWVCNDGGTDVRNNFLRDLYGALNQKGIYTFVDSEELRKGEQISPTLMSVIEESRVAIIIFSEDYAFSRWCLKELAKIMECKARKELIVLPVFYKVEPREVRRAIKGYGRAMAKHESDSENDLKAVEIWKKALFDAGNLSGWVCNDGEPTAEKLIDIVKSAFLIAYTKRRYARRDEAEVIQSIVRELPIHLERTPLDVAKYPVGIESLVEELKSMSQKELDGDDVLMIGIWGPGGIGKTTIAKAIYNAIEGQFRGAIFLERVRETSNNCDGLVELQRRLLSQIFPPKHVMVRSVAEGISLIKLEEAIGLAKEVESL